MKRMISALLAVLLIVSLCCVFTACSDLSSFLNDIIDVIDEGENADPGDSGDIIIVDPDDPTEPTEPDDPVIVDPVEPDEPTEPTEPDDPVIVDPAETDNGKKDEEPDDVGITVDKDGEYDDKDHVALYIHLYGKLPKNYMTKKQAEAKGWTGGSLDQLIKGKAIGGTYFGNYEGLLPKKKGRSYYECDIDTIGSKSRGAKRIIYSDDGLVYYTDDHYETFTLLYGEE